MPKPARFSSPQFVPSQRDGLSIAQAVRAWNDFGPQFDGSIGRMAPRGGPLIRPPTAILILVNGSAASGKTTLANALAEALRLPLISKDELKESLMDSLGCPDRARSRELGGATYALLYLLMERLLSAGVSLIVDANFSHVVSDREILQVAGNARIAQVLCQTSDAEVFRRYRERAESGDRHPAHHDTAPETIADLQTSLAGNRHQPLDLGAPLLVVDTTDGYSPGFEEIVAFARAAMA